MSFIIAVYVHEGIVLASDSRTTYSRTLQQNNGSTVQQIGIHTTNSTKKTFLCNNNIAISTCGDASVQGLPITGYIETFSRKHLTTDTDIAQVPQLLLNFFKDYNPIPNTNFIVAGYSTLGEQKQQKIYKVLLKDGAISEIQTSGMQGAIWDGEILVLTRLLQPVGLKKDDGKYNDLPKNEILWNYFTLQDAVDFARYAVNTTIQTMRFQNVVETVGGNVDVLVITPDYAKWLQHKEVH